MSLHFPFGRLALVALLVAESGCLTPKTVSPESAPSDKVERREGVMLKSKLGSTPTQAGWDSRARDIEKSLGIR